MNKIIALAGILFLSISVQLYAQDFQAPATPTNGDARIDQLVELHQAYNEAFPYVSGYRIQIFMESGNQALEDAEATREKFEEDYSDTPAYITFSEPYYRLRVGDFRTRLEAMRFLEVIKRKYANAWVIKDNISFTNTTIHQKTN